MSAKKKTPTFLPMPGKIVVRLHEDERIGSLLLPPSAQRSKVLGTIIAIGGDEEEDDDSSFYPLAVGDVVLFGQNSGIRVEVDRVSVLILRTSEILTKVHWHDENGQFIVNPLEASDE